MVSSKMSTSRHWTYHDEDDGSVSWQCSRRHPVQPKGGVCAVCLRERLSKIVWSGGRPEDQASSCPPMVACGRYGRLQAAHCGSNSGGNAEFVQQSDDDVHGPQEMWRAGEYTSVSEQSIASLIEREIEEGRHRPSSDAAATGCADQSSNEALRHAHRCASCAHLQRSSSSTTTNRRGHVLLTKSKSTGSYALHNRHAPNYWCRATGKLLMWTHKRSIDTSLQYDTSPTVGLPHLSSMAGPLDANSSLSSTTLPASCTSEFNEEVANRKPRAEFMMWKVNVRRLFTTSFFHLVNRSRMPKSSTLASNYNMQDSSCSPPARLSTHEPLINVYDHASYIKAHQTSGWRCRFPCFKSHYISWARCTATDKVLPKMQSMLDSLDTCSNTGSYNSEVAAALSTHLQIVEEANKNKTINSSRERTSGVQGGVAASNGSRPLLDKAGRSFGSASSTNYSATCSWQAGYVADPSTFTGTMCSSSDGLYAGNNIITQATQPCKSIAALIYI